MNTINKYINNGVLIPIGCCIYYYFSSDFLLSIYTYLKLFSAYYYITFKNLYIYPDLYKYKHLVRLTDTGHIANFLYYINPELFFSITHNILFIITTAFYTCFFVFNLNGTDDMNDRYVIIWMQDFHMHLNHILPYGIILYNIINKKHSHEVCQFNYDNLINTYTWLYLWLFCIYIPWRFFTNDPVYSVLSNSTSLKVKTIVIVCVHIIAYLSNVVGYLLTC